MACIYPPLSETHMMNALGVADDAQLETALYSFVYAQLEIAEKVGQSGQSVLASSESIPPGCALDIELQAGAEALTRDLMQDIQSQKRTNDKDVSEDCGQIFGFHADEIHNDLEFS